MREEVERFDGLGQAGKRCVYWEKTKTVSFPEDK